MQKKKRIALKVVFVGMQIIYPYHQTEISWLFLQLFGLLHFILYNFYESKMFM